jgi:hypothetical protein
MSKVIRACTDDAGTPHAVQASVPYIAGVCTMPGEHRELVGSWHQAVAVSHLHCLLLILDVVVLDRVHRLVCRAVGHRHIIAGG